MEAFLLFLMSAGKTLFAKAAVAGKTAAASSTYSNYAASVIKSGNAAGSAKTSYGAQSFLSGNPFTRSMSKVDFGEVVLREPQVAVIDGQMRDVTTEDLSDGPAAASRAIRRANGLPGDTNFQGVEQAVEDFKALLDPQRLAFFVLGGALIIIALAMLAKASADRATDAFTPIDRRVKEAQIEGMKALQAMPASPEKSKETLTAYPDPGPRLSPFEFSGGAELVTVPKRDVKSIPTKIKEAGDRIGKIGLSDALRTSPPRKAPKKPTDKGE